MTQIEDRVRSGLQAEAEAVARVGTAAVSTTYDRPRVSLSGAGLAAVMAVAVLVIFGGIALFTGGSGDPANDPLPTPSSVPTASDLDRPFQGTWISTSDTDGGTQTMTVVVLADDAVEVVVLDTIATLCSATPSKMTGTGRIEEGTRLVIPEPVYTCDDGSEPATSGAPPLQELLSDWTLILDPRTDTLSDGVGGLWLREGAEAPIPDLPISDSSWPQKSAEELREAQERANAGDPDYTWQVDAGLASDEAFSYLLEPGQVELVDRFLREVLGWEAYLLNTSEGSEWDFTDNGLFDVRFLRCAPGRVNPIYPPQPNSEQPGESCAPTLDDLRYESVSLDLVQPVRQGPGGIWLVNKWRSTAFAQADPVVAEAQATERLEAFLAARIAGEGAEWDVDVYDDWPVKREVPLLYATTTGAPYERYEFERVDGPDWPYGGYITFAVRLFADGGATVVEQEIYSHWDGGRSAGIAGGLAMERPTTTENGQPVPVPYYFFDDEVVAWVPGPWWWIGSLDESSRFIDFSDPVAGDPVAQRMCAPAMEPADAATLAQQVIADPNFETTAPVAASVGGLEAVSIDVARAPGASFSCWRVREPYGVWIYALEPGLRQRLYLVDLPEGMPMRTLAITVTAHESRFEEVIEEAQPIIDSIEFHP